MKATSLLPLAALLLSTGSRAQSPADRARAEVEKLPGIGALVLRDVAADAATGVFSIAVPKPGVLALGFQVPPEGAGTWHAGILIEDPRVVTFGPRYPRLAEDLLGDPRLDSLLIVCTAKDQKVAVTQVPEALRAALAGFGDSKGSLELKEGVNLFATLLPSEGGLLGFVRQVLSVQQPARLSGQIDAETVEHALRQVGLPSSEFKPADAAPKSSKLSLTVALPEATPPPFGALGDRALVHLTYPSTRLTIARSTAKKDGKSSESYEVTGDQKARLWLLGKQIDLDGTCVFKWDDKKYEIARKAAATVDWHDAFGLPGFTLKRVSLDGKLELPAQGGLGPVELGLGATVVLPRHGELEGRFALAIADQKLGDLSLTLEGKDESGIQLGALPGYERIPGADQFRIDKLSIGINPTKGDVYLSGGATWVPHKISGEAALVHASTGKGGKASVLFLQADGLNLRKLVPTLPPEAEAFSLDRAMLAVSTADFETLKAGALPGPLKEMMKKVTGDLERDLPVFKGLTLFARMDPTRVSPEARAALAEIGLTEPLVLAGSIGGLADGKPSIALYADLPSLPALPRAPSYLNLAPRARSGGKVDVQGTGARCLLVVKNEAAGPEIQLGLEGTIGVRVQDDELVLRGQVFVQNNATGVGLRLAGRMQGEWDEPFGLKGIKYSDVTLGGGIDADSAVELALQGKATIGRLEYELGGVLSLLAASGGLVPKKVAFRFKGNEMSQLTQLELMTTFVRAAVSGPLASAIPPGETQRLLQQAANANLIGKAQETLPLPMLKYRDVEVYLMTPGASFPGVEMNGMGIALKGSMLFMNHTLGSVDNFLTVQDGLQVHRRAGDLDIGLVALSNTEMKLRVPMPGIKSASADQAGFEIRGTVGAGCSALAGGLDIAILRDEASFATSVKLADYQGQVDASVDLSEWPKWGLRGVLGDDFVKDLVQTVRDAVREHSQAALDQAKQAVAQARTEVEAKRKAHQAALEKGKAAVRAEAEASLNQAKQMARDLANQYSDRPVVSAALRGLQDLANRLQVAKNDSVASLDEVRSKVGEVRNLAAKLPGNLAAQVRGRLDEFKSRIDAAANKLANLQQSARELPAVKAAENAVAEAHKAVDDLKKTVAAKTDPLAAAANNLVDTVQIEHVGFDSGLEALCRGELPRLSVRGTFAGQPFTFDRAFVLAARGQLAGRNKDELKKLATALFQMVDPGQVDALVRQLAAGS